MIARLRFAGRLLPLAAVCCCAAALAPAVEKDASFTAALESISAGELQQHVDYLAADRLEGREAGRRGGRAAAEYLSKQLGQLAIPGGARGGNYFQHFAPNFRNVLAVVEGSHPELKNEVIVVSAHYDHVGYGTRRNSRGPIGYIHNGADDNASGTSGLLELAEALALLGEAPKRSILLAFWDAEEKGLLGSKHWVSHPTVPLRNARAIVNMDMIGRLRSDRVTIHGTRTGFGLRRLLARQNQGTDLYLEFNWDVKPKADHYPFVQRNVPALLLHTGLHGEYHTPRDDAQLIDAEGMSRVIRFLFRTVVELADRAEVSGFRSAAWQESEYTRKRLAKAPAPLPGRLGVGWSWRDPAGEGVRLHQVNYDSAAQRAGLKPGDRIVRFDEREIHRGEDLIGVVAVAASPAAAIVKRPGESEPLELSVQLGGMRLRLGITWRIDPAAPGTIVLTRVIPGTPAARAGLKPGDRIYQIGGEDFAGEAEFAQQAGTLAEPIQLLVERHGRLQTVLLYIDSQPPKRAA